MARFETAAYAALRIESGFLFSFHGMQKVFGWLSDHARFGTQLWFGGWLELVGGVLIALGMFARSAAFLCSGMMAVAYFQFHWKLAFDGWRFLPVVNHGEPAVLYCFLFLFVAVKGPGPVSLPWGRNR
jgi:putative oxidoreductase